MSEKLIDFADFSYMCRLGLYKACAKNCSEEICEEWKLYKEPTLADVCGKRELKDMTEEEFEELLARIDPHEDEFELPIEFGDDLQHHYHKQIRIIRWFIEHGFYVFGEDK